MSRAEHSIDKADMNFLFAEHALAGMFEQDHQTIVHEHLLAVMARVFDRLAMADSVIRIDKLQLDLGDIRCNDIGSLKQALSERLEAQLLAQLQPLVGAALRGESVANLTVTAERAARCLRRGDDVLSLDKDSPATPLLLQMILLDTLFNTRVERLAKVWSTLLAEHPQLLIDTLSAFVGNFAASQRVVAIFTDPMVADTITLLEPAAKAMVLPLIDRPQILRQALVNCAPDTTVIGEKSLRTQLWSFTLHYLLSARGSEFNRTSYLEQLLQQQAAHNNLGYAQLLGQFTDVIEQLPQGGQWQQQLLQLLGGLQDKVKQGKAPQDDEEALSVKLSQLEHEQDTIGVDLKVLYAVVETALLEGSMAELQRLWPQLLEQHNHWLRATVYRTGQLVLVRHHLSKAVAKAQLKGFWPLIVGAGYELVEAMVEQPAIIQTAVQSAQPQVVEQTDSELLCYFSLTYLLVERGSQFNRRQYLYSVLTQTAAHHNLKLTTLVDSLHQVLEKLVCRGTALSALAEWVGAWQQTAQTTDEPATVLPVATEEEDHRPPTTRAVLSLYYQLLYSLCDIGQGLTPEGYDTALESLSQSSSVLFNRLWQQLKQSLQQRRTSDVSVAQKLGKPGLLQLCRQVARSQSGQIPDLLLKALMGQWVKATNPARFALALLQMLIEGKPIDLEQLQLAGKVPVEKPVVESTSKVEKANEKVQLKSAELDVQLKRYLWRGEGVTAGLKAHALRMISTRPEQLLKLLGRMWHQDAVIERVTELFTPQALLKLLMVGRKGDWAPLLEAVELLMVGGSKLLGNPGWQAEGRWQWQVLLRYAMAEGRSVVMAPLLRYVARQLWLLSPATEPQAFNQQLCEHIADVCGSVSQPLVEAIGRVLSDTDTGDEELTVPTLEPVEQGEVIEIANAGLVLAGAFLPMLFERLDWLGEDGFKSSSLAERAVVLLQYLACGEPTQPDDELMLNKLLCGLEAHQPLSTLPQLTDDEQTLADQLVASMNSHWGATPNTSVSGFRQTFLHRRGWLEKTGDAQWRLTIEYLPVDILRSGSEIPWGFSLIKCRWMNDAVHVIWDRTSERP